MPYLTSRRYFSAEGNVLFRILLVIALGLSLSKLALAQEGVPFQLPPKKELRKLQTAVLKTSRGRIIIELYPEIAPYHVANLKFLADQDFYDGIRFHITRPGIIIQAGTPRRDDPDAGPGYSLPPEFSDLRHVRGVVGMARRPDLLNRGRNSHGSQFHILLTDASKMDGSFTIFGRVVKGMDVADDIVKGDRIEDLVVYVRKKK